MNTSIKRIGILLCLLGFLVLPYFVFAASPLEALHAVATKANYAPVGSTSVAEIAGTIVAATLSLLGVLFICLLVYSGIIWMTAEGDEAKVEKAQKIMRNAIVGLIITVSVYAIYQIFEVLLLKNLI